MAEILKIREITIDTMQHKEFNVKEEELKLIRFYQNDLNSAKLLINVTHDKVVTDFSSATSVQIAFLKPDGKRVFQDVQNVNQMQGKYYVVLSTQTLIAYGNVIAQLRFTFPNNKVIETCMFAFIVDESIMSDDAMKSTNEFPVIQKAIEAGKKFEGVDIDGIIAAGELAKGALPKTGGTMTGNFGVQIPNAGSNGISFKSTSGTDIHNWIGTSTGAVAWQDKLANTDVFNYSSVSKTLTMMNGVTFNVSGATNLLKKTGDTMTGPLKLDRVVGTSTAYNVLATGALINYYVGLNVQGKYHLYDDINKITPFEYDPATQEFKVHSNTNLLKKTGDTATGPMIFRHNINHESSDGQKGVNIVVNSSVNKWAIGPKTTGTVDWANEFAMNLTNGEVTVSSLKTKKDGFSVLTLTADALVVDSNSPPVAIRRGNSVTFRCYMYRKTGSASNLMTTLPVDMRPVYTVYVNALGHDGTVCRVTIGTDGNVFIGTSSGKETEGKQLAENITFVVN